MNKLSSSLHTLSSLLQQTSDVFADLADEISARSTAVEMIEADDFKPPKRPKPKHVRPKAPPLTGGLGAAGNGTAEPDAPLVGRIRRRDKKGVLQVARTKTNKDGTGADSG